jgi:hypothetical protein
MGTERILSSRSTLKVVQSPRRTSQSRRGPVFNSTIDTTTIATASTSLAQRPKLVGSTQSPNCRETPCKFTKNWQRKVPSNGGADATGRKRKLDRRKQLEERKTPYCQLPGLGRRSLALTIALRLLARPLSSQNGSHAARFCIHRSERVS